MLILFPCIEALFPGTSSNLPVPKTFQSFLGHYLLTWHLFWLFSWLAFHKHFRHLFSISNCHNHHAYFRYIISSFLSSLLLNHHYLNFLTLYYTTFSCLNYFWIYLLKFHQLFYHRLVILLAQLKVYCIFVYPFILLCGLNIGY